MANQSGYTGAQIMAMQKDAMRRVNEMQRISREKLRQTQGIMQEVPAEAANPPANPVEAKEEEPQMIESEIKETAAEEQIAVSQNTGTGLQGILQRMNLDGETIMLLLLVLILINEGADNMLVLALVYILL